MDELSETEIRALREKIRDLEKMIEGLRMELEISASLVQDCMEISKEFALAPEISRSEGDSK